jgi:hypothetical protein
MPAYGISTPNMPSSARSYMSNHSASRNQCRMWYRMWGLSVVGKATVVVAEVSIYNAPLPPLPHPYPPPPPPTTHCVTVTSRLQHADPDYVTKKCLDVDH